MKNVFYGSDTAQVLDVYLPLTRNSTDARVILFIHGGSWIAGDKSEFNAAIAALHPQLPDYAIFNINYRLANSSEHRFPIQSEDIQSAISFIESKANEYKINVNKVGLIGASAGAHLSLLQAYKFNSEQKIKAVVDLFGPSDLTDLYNNHPISQQAQALLLHLTGKTPLTDPGLYKQASPINYINSKSVPTLIFHGANDLVVPISQSHKLKATLLANDVKVEMTAYATEGHGWYGRNLIDTYTKTVKFIRENVY